MLEDGREKDEEGDKDKDGENDKGTDRGTDKDKMEVDGEEDTTTTISTGFTRFLSMTFFWPRVANPFNSLET